MKNDMINGIKIMIFRIYSMVVYIPLLAACSVNGANVAGATDNDGLAQKFRGIRGVIIRVDAATPKDGTVVMSETGRIIDAAGSLSLDSSRESTYTNNSLPVPKTVRITWREGKIEYQWKGAWTGGVIVGDYTVPVASRIPDDVLNYVKNTGGALRIKIRIVDDGVLIGWDVERSLPIPGCTEKRGCTALHYLLAGGDFRERRPGYDGIPDSGWQNKVRN